MLLTAGERTLLHLIQFWNAKDPPEAITQQGIADSARIRRSHVPRTVKALAKDGYVEEREGHVRGRGRKVKLYFLTENGLRRARDLARALEAQPILAEGEATSLGQFAKATNRTLLEIALELDEEGRYRGSAREVGVPTFLGRREELSRLASWLRGDATVLVVYGGTGMGKTALAQRFLQRSSRAHWWKDLRADDGGSGLLSDLASGLHIDATRESASKDVDSWSILAAGIRGRDALLVFDNYGEVSEDIVEFFRHLARIAREGHAKVLVLAEENTPSYCRFYDRRDVESGRVEELRLRGLSMDESRDLLGNSRIAEESLRRIFLLTKGCPLYLKLIREGDAETLRVRSRFTNAEINLLLFSRDVVA